MERDTILKIFAYNLRKIRRDRDFTQEYLTEKADITQEYLARIEGAKFSPSLVVIVNLALALDVSIDKLIPLDEVNKKN